MNTLLLLILLSLLFLGAFCVLGGDLISPSCLFCGGLLLACAGLLPNIIRWGDISTCTVGVISIYVVIFLLGTSFVRLISSHPICMSRRIISEDPSEAIHGSVVNRFPRYIYLSSSFLWLCLAVVLITGFLTLRGVVAAAAPYGGGGDLVKSIDIYNNIGKFSETESVSLPSYVSHLNYAVSAWTYLAMFVLSNNWFANKEFSPLLLLNSLLGITCKMLTGSRGGAIQDAIVFVFVLILVARIWGKAKTVPFKYVVVGLILAILLVTTFQEVGVLLGREIDMDAFEYLSIYLSAPIKNLDVWLKSFPLATHASCGLAASDVWGKETFVNQIQWLGQNFGVADWVYKLDIPFLAIGSYNMGNVYTTFYAFLYDFGYLGCGLCVFAMGLISQCLYEYQGKLVGIGYNAGSVTLRTPFLANVLWMLLFSFFSNKFFEGLSFVWIWTFFWWFILKYFICREQELFQKRSSAMYYKTDADVSCYSVDSIGAVKHQSSFRSKAI